MQFLTIWNHASTRHSSKKRITLIIKAAVLAAFILLSASCVSHPVVEPEDESVLYPPETYIPKSFDWQEIHKGIWRFDFENPEFPIIYHAVKIDLTNPELTPVCFPTSCTSQKSVQKGKKTSSFAKQENCIIAFNTSPFSVSGTKKQIVGILIDDKTQLSAPVEKYSALIINRLPGTQGLSASITQTQTTQAFENCDYALGGFYMILQDGVVLDFKTRIHTSRCGCGVSEDGKTLYILVAEGQQPSKSEGLSYPQCAQIFKAMGCDDAMEFDGGGSAELCINGKSVLSYPVSRTQAASFGFVLFRLP